MLRYGGALHLVSGQIIVEAEFDTGAPRGDLRATLKDVYGHDSEVTVIQPAGIRKHARYVVRVVAGGAALARQTGLVDGAGRPVRGCPRRWWAAACATPRRCGEAPFSPTVRSPSRVAREVWRSPVPARRRRWPWWVRPAGSAWWPSRERCGGIDRVVIRDGDTISAMLTRLGAHQSLLEWEERRLRREVRQPPTGWPTSMTRICAVRHVLRWRPVPGCNGRWNCSATTSRITSPKPGGCGWSTSRRV